MPPPTSTSGASSKATSHKKRPFPSSSGGNTNNAFSMLMSKSSSSHNKQLPLSSSTTKKPRQKITSNRVGFVECPAGCGRHLPNLEHKINQHLDQQCPKLKEPLEREQNISQHCSIATENTASEVSQTFNISPQIAVKENEPSSEFDNVDTPPSKTPDMQQLPETKNGSSSEDKDSSDSPDNRQHAITPSTTIISAKNTPSSGEGVSDEGQHDKEGHKNSEVDSAHVSLVSPEQVNSKTPTIPATPSSPASTSTANNPYQQTSKQSTVATPLPANNAFTHMMKRSTQVFAATKNTTPDTVPQYFAVEYISERDEFDLNLTPQEVETWDPPLWTATVQVKDKSPGEDAPPMVVALKLAVTIRTAADERSSSSCQRAQTPSSQQRLVQYHSRLSVPVLKSMLQKSIRRRSPLPAVRVAMELLDKSCGELMRRLPIIMLEDATLHPDLPLVVWMMIAHSKGLFDLDTSPKPSVSHLNMLHAMKIRLLRIVYQVASCPHQDHLQEEDSTPSDNNSSYPSISKPFQSLQTANGKCKQKEGLVMVWGMLVRAAYGGMACDVSMLKRFAQVWHDRLQESSAPPSPPALECTWSEVPYHVHQKGMEQSLLRIPASTRMEKLCLSDICKEGIDFHCSNLVDCLLKDSEVMEACRSLNDNSNSSLDPEQVLKRCIWKFSAGVNLRRPLVEGQQGRAEGNEDLKEFWNKVLSPRVQAFQTRYLQERLR